MTDKAGGEGRWLRVYRGEVTPALFADGFLSETCVPACVLRHGDLVAVLPADACGSV